MADTDLVVDVPVDAPPPAVVVDPAVVVEPEPQPAAQPEEPIAELKKQLEEIRTREAAATANAAAKDAEARRNADEASKAKEALAKVNSELADSNVTAIDSAISAAQAEADNWQREQQAALTASDYVKAADAGRKMARAEARVIRLEEGKADAEARKSEAPRVETPAVPAQPADPFEAAIANAAPRARQWLRDHREYVTDRKLSLKAAAADSLALSEGIERETDAYFEFCERQLGLKTDPVSATTAAPAQRAQQPETRTRTMPAAPVSRDTTPSGGATTPTQVKLSPGEQRAATDGSVVWNYSDPKLGAVKGQPVGIKEYARRKLAMTGEGRYDRSYTDQ